MIDQIPLKSGQKYTIYSFDTASRIPRKREITFVGNITEYKVHKGRERASIGRFISSGSHQPLALIINYSRDLILEGWGHPSIHQEYPDKVVLNATFEEVFSLRLQNLNPNFVGDKSLYCFKKYKDAEPFQAFPVQEPPKVSLENFTNILKDVVATPTEKGDAVILSLPKEHQLKLGK